MPVLWKLKSGIVMCSEDDWVPSSRRGFEPWLPILLVGLFLHLYNRDNNSYPLMERTNQMAAQVLWNLYHSCSPKVDIRIWETSTLALVFRTMFRNNCILIWRSIFVTAANQKNEANIVKQNVYFMGLLYSEIMCFFFFAVQVPFLLWNMMMVDCRMFCFVLF